MELLRRWSLRLLRLVVLFYALVSAGLYLFQESLLFHPSQVSAETRYPLALPYEERFTGEGESRVHNLLIRAPKARGLLLHFHGNAGNLSDWAELGETLAKRLGLDVWMMDFPGFGKSGGAIRSEAQLHAAAEAAFRAARAEAGARPLVIYGRSMGTGLAAHLASEHEVAALVLETPYDSMRRLAASIYPWAPVFLLRYPLRSDEWLPKVPVSIPVLVLHGTDDELIPFEHGRDLAARRPGTRFVAVPGGHHNNLRRFPQYWGELEAFLREIPGTPAR